jgi:hypothetical protein
LKYRGERFAEVCLDSEGEPFALTFRIPRESFHLPGMGQLLTVENLLKAVGRSAGEVESWRHEGACHTEPGQPLPAPPNDVTHLNLHVNLKQPSANATTAADASAAEIPEEKWQDLESRWKAILGLEASIDTLRIGMESLRSEMESSSNKMLTPDEKVHALNADVAQWNKAKGRVVYSLPKLREFVHRATWLAGAPERKELEELIETHVRQRAAFPGMDQLLERLESLLKDRQVLSAIGVSVQQECKGVAAEVQRALRTVQGNAAAIAAKKRGAARGKSY